ncbi:hypothetical protein Ddc_23901 [Ditylenchus destructor]|nr:hypothetical protein Ddc_23901 [Ditylenchus destructor]
MFEKTLLEAAAEMSKWKFIRFFALLLFHANPPNKIGLFYNAKIFEELALSLQGSKEERTENILCRLQYYFLQYGTTCAEQGLPDPKHFSDELLQKLTDEREEQEFQFSDNIGGFTSGKPNKRNWEKAAEEYEKKFEEDQSEAYKCIFNAMNSRDAKEKRFFFLSGMAF